jgi:predicted nucleic acid-binding protein
MVMPVKGSILVRAMGMVVEHGVHYWDALIISVMEVNGLRTILTEDVTDFGSIPWLNVVNLLE